MNIFSKIVFWVKGFSREEQNTRKCHGCCINCEYYENCKAELG